MKKRHDASAYRRIIRESKKSNDKQLLSFLDEARELKDPYYSALALFALSSDIRIDPITATAAANEALDFAGAVDQQWRKAEVLTQFVKHLRAWRKDSTKHDKDKYLERIIDIVNEMPEGQGLSDAISGISPDIGIERLKVLLLKALTNTGFENNDSKSVIRSWVTGSPKNSHSLNELFNLLREVDEPALRAQILGYLHLQLRKARLADIDRPTLEHAVDAAMAVDEHERNNVIRYLAGIAESETELNVVAACLDKLEDPEDRTRVLSALGGSADKANLRPLAVRWFNEGLGFLKEVRDVNARIKISINLARGLARCGEKESAHIVYRKALNDAGDNPALKNRICRSMEADGFKVDNDQKIKKSEDKIGIGPGDEMITEKGSNNVLALYDTYEGGLKPIHLRAIARAAPLCYAFDLDLALMGFPSNDLNKLVEQVISETDIGKGGKYLKELLGEDRITLVNCTQHDPPKNWDDLGLPVATTERPKDDKNIELVKVLELANGGHPKNRACVIIGLGKRGLPHSLLETVPHHLELTGRNIGLETCTAMGVIAQQLKI